MSRKEEILKNAAEMAARERERQSSPDRPYSGRGMDTTRMPAGCWLWLIVAVVVAVYLVSELSRRS